MIKCNSCGAAFDEKEPKCPYCGTLNEAGAQKEYNKKLNRIRKNLDVVDDVAKDDYKAGVKSFFKGFCATMLVAMIITLLMAASYKGAKTVERNTRAKESKANIQRMADLRPGIEAMNSLYDEGRYEELCEMFAMIENRENRDLLRSWKHYEFEQAYRDYMSACENTDEAFERGDKYSFAAALQDICVFYYRYVNEKTSYIQFTKSDKATLAECHSELLALAEEKLSISAEEYDRIYALATEERYPSYSVISDYAKERFGEE